MKKRIPIGISDFKRLIEGGYLFVDKTLLIQELVEKGTIVTLIPRPRRFGKTLNLSMVRYFFEKSEHDTSHLFSSLNIWKSESCRAMQGQFPVIFFSLKDIKHTSWEKTFESLRRLIASEFQRHDYLLEGNFLKAPEKDNYIKILHEEESQTLFEESLKLLTKWLHRYHNKLVVVLIDEYDTPAHASYVGGYYETLIPFLRNWLSGGLKDNSSLERGVLTGILRIAKESIFSGLNNDSTYTIIDEKFNDKFGLLESEVKDLLEQYGLESKLVEVRSWYDGYQVGSCKGIYNPWSVMKYIAENGALAPYWVNTSDNALMKQLITTGTDALKIDVEILMKGGIIEKNIEEGIVFSNLKKNSDALWSLLLYSGYLTITKAPSYGVPTGMRIPNIEVGEVYKTMVREWFDESITRDDYNLLLRSLTSGDIDTFSKIFQRFLISSLSFFDISSEEPEKVYHIFVLGMLVGLGDHYEVKSNRESGLGRYDVMLIPKKPKDLAIIMEFKKVGSSEKIDLETVADQALKQIEDKKYPQELRARGIKHILHLGFAFRGKEVLIRSKISF